MQTVKTGTKKLMHNAFREALEERKEIFYDIAADVMEDIALGQAIEEGLKSKRVSKERVLNALRPK